VRTMEQHLYLSLLPESLVASMLGPQEFGAYMASGARERMHEQVVFFEVKPDYRHHFFDIPGALAKCVLRPDGQPKRSVYVSIYRVLEHVPLEALGQLHLTSREGKTLSLNAASPPQFERRFHLYQELCPVHPLVISRLDPVAFSRSITDPRDSVSMPRVCFADLRLGELAYRPVNGKANDVMFENVAQLRSCLEELVSRSNMSEVFDRLFPPRLIYHSVDGGIFVGDQNGVLYYPMPSRQELQSTYQEWWESAGREVRAGDRRE
jgi:hypothetical protein